MRPRLDEKVERTATEAAKRKFAPEFMNRIDKVVVFHPLRSEQLEQILEIELGMVQQRVLETAKGRFLFRVTQPAKDFLLREGTDLKYGARHLKRAIERHLVYPLASLLATEQVCLGDVISIDWDGAENGLTFIKEAEGALLPVASPGPEASREAAAAISDGRQAFLSDSHDSRCGEHHDHASVSRADEPREKISRRSSSIFAVKPAGAGASTEAVFVLARFPPTPNSHSEKNRPANNAPLQQHRCKYTATTTHSYNHPATSTPLQSPLKPRTCHPERSEGSAFALDSCEVELLTMASSAGWACERRPLRRGGRRASNAARSSRISGLVSASSAIERIASMNRSHSSFDSDSVGSIIIAPGTISGNAVV